jgi:hypothetical protein
VGQLKFSKRRRPYLKDDEGGEIATDMIWRRKDGGGREGDEDWRGMLV